MEKLICENGSLGGDDEELTEYYEALLKTVEPGAQPDLVQSQKKWIAERERCSFTAKSAKELFLCVGDSSRQRIGFLRTRIQEIAAQQRLSEFSKFDLKTFKEPAFEFQYPSPWVLHTTEDGRISLKSDPQEMTIGFDKTLTSPEKCTYKETGTSEADIQRSFYMGKVQIGGHEFYTFHRAWIPNGFYEYYYGFFRGHCFTIGVFDDSWSGRTCGFLDDARNQADCEIKELEAKDLMHYSDGVIKTIRFLHDQN